MTYWRSEPATEAQKRRLREEGIRIRDKLSKGEASDLIGSTVEPSEWEIEQLKFFKVTGISQMSETDARRKLDELFEDPENHVRWENRPASKEQKEIYKFFGIKVPVRLKHKDAEKFLDELFEDDSKYDAWIEHEEEKDNREHWFQDTLEYMNESREIYDCKKISKILFKQVVESLEASGMTLEEIESDEEHFFEKALEINPQLFRAPRRVSHSIQKRKQKDASPGFAAISGFIFGGVLILTLIFFIN